MDVPQIDKDVPLPATPRRGRKISELAISLMSMEPGDSMFFLEPDKVARIKLYNSIHKMAKRHNFAITARFIENGLRIWRK